MDEFKAWIKAQINIIITSARLAAGFVKLMFKNVVKLAKGLWILSVGWVRNVFSKLFGALSRFFKKIGDWLDPGPLKPPNNKK